jgi:hypothetical protein
MRGTSATVVLALLCACGTPALPPDAGVDAGSTDAGPRCFGAQARLAAQCVGLDFFRANACAASPGATVAAHLGNCDAGRPVFRGDCGADLESASWTYGPFGDRYECVYARDGGALVGAFNFSDHGVLVAGTVSECTAQAQCP